MEKDKAFDPVDVSFFRPDAVMPRPDRLRTWLRSLGFGGVVGALAAILRTS